MALLKVNLLETLFIVPYAFSALLQRQPSKKFKKIVKSEVKNKKIDKNYHQEVDGKISSNARRKPTLEITHNS